MKDLSRKVDELISQMGGYWNELGLFSALVEEVGELAEIFRKIALGEKDYLTKLEEELGDTFFALICIANVYGVDLERALLKSIEKYRKRDLKNFE